MELNATWHSRLPKVVFSNIIRTVRHVCYGAEFGGMYYAVAIWTRRLRFCPVCGAKGWTLEQNLPAWQFPLPGAVVESEGE